jgi:hypothetical protein
MVEHVLTMNPGGEWEVLQAPVSPGTWRRAKTSHDKWGQELDSFDTRAEIGFDLDLDQLDALDAWYRLCVLIGRFMSLCGALNDAPCARLAIAALFCRLEDMRDTIEPAQSTSRPPAPADVQLIRITPPPYLEHVNECDPPSKIGGPSKYLRAKNLHQRKPTLQQRFAVSIFNHGDATANERYRRMFPEPPRMGVKVIVRRLRDYAYEPPASRVMIEYAPYRFISQQCEAVLREPRPVKIETIADLQMPTLRALPPRQPYIPKEAVLNADGTINEYCRAIDLYLTDQLSLPEMFARMSQSTREHTP